jgi:hypothetical protein
MARAQASPTDEISRVTLALRGYRVLLDSSLPQRKPGRGRNIEFLSYAYTERGAIMLAAVLNSYRAIEMSIYIVRAFVQLRELLSSSEGPCEAA